MSARIIRFPGAKVSYPAAPTESAQIYRVRPLRGDAYAYEIRKNLPGTVRSLVFTRSEIAALKEQILAIEELEAIEREVTR